MPHAKSTKDQRRTLRRLTMQVLYQIDVTGQTEAQALADALDDEHDTPEARAAAAEAGVKAWDRHAEYDALLTDLSPDWPTHRQPPVDRAILRLACAEIASGITPPKVAISEAVELAKQFGTEHSPSFINGVLDKAARALAPPADNQPTTLTADQWLDDALGDRS
ncbi:MAG: transcription antitermination factor NusB [Planctomycetes bacterium]|jgi:N utilization substance protein B|nr:transcription antitermination factor NusB [Planctomycetota bacterium]